MQVRTFYNQIIDILIVAEWASQTYSGHVQSIKYILTDTIHSSSIRPKTAGRTVVSVMHILPTVHCRCLNELNKHSDPMEAVLFLGFKIVAHMMPDLPNVDFEVSISLYYQSLNKAVNFLA